MFSLRLLHIFLFRAIIHHLYYHILMVCTMVLIAAP